MSKVSALLTVPLVAGWDAEASLEVFTNQGSGAVDYDAPLLSVPLATLATVIQPAGVGADPIGAMPIGHGKAHAAGEHLGVGAIPIGDGPIGSSIEVIEVEVMVEQGFGTYKFAARVLDAAGNAQEDPPAEFELFVSGEDPPTPSGLRVEAYDDETDQCTFSVAS